MEDLLAQQLLQPRACPTRARADCLRDLAVVYADRDLHEAVARGHWANHLCNALDGSEDHLGTGAAASFWRELGMSELRDQAQRSLPFAYIPPP